MNNTKLIIGGVVAVFLVVAAFIVNPTYSVDQGEQAVVLTWGQATGDAGPGLHFKMPFAQGVQLISTQSHFEDFPNGNTGNKFEAYSKDQQPADIQISVNYHVASDAVTQVYAGYGNVDNLVFRTLDQMTPAVFKNVFGQYDAQSAIQSRAKLNSDVLQALQAAIANEPIVVESVQIKDIKFSADYEAAIAAKQKAVVQVQEQQQVLDQEVIKAKIAVTQAQAQADSRLAVATNDAKAVQINGEAAAAAIKAKGDAEAEVIKAKADALAGNPLLTDLTKAESWDGKLPTTMLPDGALPFINAAPAPAPTAK